MIYSSNIFYIMSHQIKHQKIF